jgi:hypothetical protein
VKRLMLLICALCLTACAPLLQTVQGERGSVSIKVGAVLLSNPGPDTLRAPAVLVEGTAELTLPAVLLDASGKPIADTGCTKNTSGRWDCVLPDVPAGQRYRLAPVTGAATWASASGYRDSHLGGRVPVYLQSR